MNFETASGGTHIMYCWHDVPGLHKSASLHRKWFKQPRSRHRFGIPPLNNSTEENTNTDSNSGWHWYDNKRNTYNPANNFLLAGAAYYENRAQNNTADVSSYTVDFLSTDSDYHTVPTISTMQVKLTSMQHGQKHQHLTCMAHSPAQDN